MIYCLLTTFFSKYLKVPKKTMHSHWCNKPGCMAAMRNLCTVEKAFRERNLTLSSHPRDILGDVSYHMSPPHTHTEFLSHPNFSSSLLLHLSSITVCVLSNSVPCLGINCCSRLELNFPVIGKPSNVSNWYELWFLWTICRGAENLAGASCP